MGSSGRSSSAGAAAVANPGPEDQGLISWAYDPATMATNGLVTAGVLNLVKLPIRGAKNITNVLCAVQGAGATLTAGQNFMALYSSAGALLGVTADQTTPWGTTGLKTAALVSGPFAVSAGFIYVGLWANGTTPPNFFRGTNTGANPINAGLTAPNLRAATADTGVTTTAPSNFGTQTGSSSVPWMAVS